MTFLGIDLGTSSVKALLIDEEQRILAKSTMELVVQRPKQGWSEQNPQDWIDATIKVLSEIRSNAFDKYAVIKGIGLSGHMHGATLLDEKGDVLRPCILWNDTRSYVEAAQLDAKPDFQNITGNIVFPGFTAPKISWLRKHERQIFDRIAKILLPKDYIRYWLTGKIICDMSDASGTSWLDVESRNWSEKLLKQTNLTLEHMPELVEGSDASATILQDRAVELCLSTDVIIAGGAGDNAASAIGMGMTEPGDAFLSLGTSGVLFAVNDQYRPNPKSATHAFCHAIPNTWHQMGVILCATDALNWLSKITGKSPVELDDALPQSINEPSELTFLPYFSGERTPHNDAFIRGSFIGLNQETDSIAMTKSVLEGVSFAFKDCLSALQEAGTDIERVTAVGGGSSSKYWIELLATVMGVTVDIPKAGNFGASLGAARLGLIASTDHSISSVCVKPEIIKSVQPRIDLVKKYNARYKKYCALYEAIKPLHKD